VLDLVNLKVEGKEVTTVAPEMHRAQVIDLMDALKQSLAKRTGSRAEPSEPMTKKPPMKATKRPAEQEKVDKRAQAGKK
jgi:non-homologous end joining protein Ku